MNTTLVICATCSNEFAKKSTEVRRSNKAGRLHFCSRSCCGKNNTKNLPKDATPPDLRSFAKNRLDDLSPFRWHMRRLMSHSKKRGRPDDVQVTLEDLRSQWDKQGGCCPYTGWRLVNNPTTLTTMPLTTMPHTPDRASVDRIDNSQGYTKENIQFIALIAQYAKNSFHEKDLVALCKAVTLMKGGMV